MAKKPDRERIEQARRSKQKENTKEIHRQQIQDTIELNRKGHRKGKVLYPAKAQQSAPAEPKKLRVAAYCRVSTQQEAQVESYEMQAVHYKDLIDRTPNYELVEIYKDNGISGTSISRRKDFIRMIRDCEAGKIDVILCKSISRFGRNIVDILTTLEKLASLTPPVEVIFETQGINTGAGGNKLLISVLSALAELESQQRSVSVTAGINYLMNEGLYKFSVKWTTGLYRDQYGRVLIDKAEADIVTYIYDSFLEGCPIQYIADALTEQGIESPKGKPNWNYSTVRSILRNEKYCGDVLYQKTYTKDFLKHIRVKNKDIPQYYWENVHPAIIPKAKWQRTQELLDKGHNHKGKPKKLEQRLSVARVKTGALRGFFLVDTTWGRKERAQFLTLLTPHNNQTNIERKPENEEI